MVNKHYLGDPDQVQFETGALDGLKLAAKSGFKIVMISNQSGVARGLLTEDQVRSVNSRMNDLLKAEGIPVVGHYYCPHHEREGVIARYKVACDCRKPATGMIEQAAREHNLDIRRSVVIGDSLVDVNLALAAGARSALVRTGYGRETESKIGALSRSRRLLVGDNLAAAVEQLVKD